MTEDGDVIERAYQAMQRGDIEGARDCFAPEAVVWHGFDRLEQSREETMRDWQAMIGSFPERGLEDVRRQSAGPEAFVQQHLFVVRGADGVRRAWPVCIVVRIVAGRIVRLEEYVDRAGSFTPGEPH